MTSANAVAETAARHNLSPSAVQALADGLARSRGGGAQWNHPELGGMGQWLGRGMLQIGDMFNHDLKVRVGAALDDLVRAGTSDDPGQEAPATPPVGGSAGWWPGEYGRPSATGSQNDMRYACFPEARRLAVQRGGTVTLYDTGSFRLTGFAQAQGATSSLAFGGPDGRVTLDDLAVVG